MENGPHAAGGYWARDKKNARVWVESTVQQPRTVQSYVEGVQTREKQDLHRADEWRSKRPFVLCYKNITPRPESSMTARSNVSLASSIAFSNNPWARTPRIGGSHVYTRVGSRVFKAKSFEPADNHYERTQPPSIPHISTNQESFRWPRASPRYQRDRMMSATFEGDSELHEDSVPVYTSQGSRRRNDVYDWSLTRHRYFFAGERAPPSGGMPVSQFPPMTSNASFSTAANAKFIA